MLQEVAAAHWNFAASAELRAKYAWVVLRHEIDYRNPAFLNEEILGQTWVGEYSGARFDRFVKLTSAKSQKVLSEAKTTWCMLDAKSMRPTRITEEVLSVIQTLERATVFNANNESRNQGMSIFEVTYKFVNRNSLFAIQIFTAQLES